MKQSKVDFFSKVDKINSELLTFSYGSLIMRLLKDYEKTDEINEQLFKMGHNIGIRLIDDFISKGNIGSCKSFKDSLEFIAKTGFKMYLGVNCDLIVYSDKEYGLAFIENPLNDFVELPDKYATLWYSNLIPGIIVGGLEAINIKIECYFSKDVLKGADSNEVRVKLVEIIEEKFIDDE